MVKNFNYFGDKESLLAKVVMKYEDGSREIFGTCLLYTSRRVTFTGKVKHSRCGAEGKPSLKRA